MKKVVTITGGTGGFALVSGLKSQNIDLKCIVNVADDGSSTGILRKELKVIPPGDIRQCIVALCQLPDNASNFLNYRFDKGFLKGHSLGNILISGLEKKYQNFEKGLEIISEILDLKGEIIPASLKPIKLNIQLKNGQKIEGEDAINKSKKIYQKGIKNIYLNKNNQPNKKFLKAIKEADIIIIGPGNLYCSLAPTLLLKGVSEAINKSKAKLFYISNLVNKKGHTNNFKVDDYVNEIHSILGEERIDFVVANNKFSGSNFVEAKIKNKERRYKLIKKALLLKKTSYSKSDKISKLRSPVIHDGEKLAKIIIETYNKNK